MTAEEQRDVFLSCFKCGRIVRSSDSECPRCGLQFGPGTLFECPFCCGLVWRNASVCTTCGIDLSKFSEGVEKTSSRFDMDEFVDTMISTEMDEIRSEDRRVACPGCGLMIKGNEVRCPRCDLPLEKALVDCPVCGDRIDASMGVCHNCGASFGAVTPRPLAVGFGERVAAPAGKPKAKQARPRADVKPKKEAPPKKTVSKKSSSKKGKTKKA